LLTFFIAKIEGLGYTSLSHALFHVEALDWEVD
jgi:hypothetical protein